MKEDLQAKQQVKQSIICPRCGFTMFIRNRLIEDFSQPAIPIGYLCTHCYAFRKEIEYELKQVDENEI